MKTKTVSIMAAIIGSLCAAFAVYVRCYQRDGIGYAMAAANNPHIERFFWWPLTAGVIFLRWRALHFFGTGNIAMTTLPNVRLHWRHY